jgi:hypothetical protein
MKTYSRKWERVDQFTQRLKTPLGWVVEVYTSSDEGGSSVCYVEDPNHLWVLANDENDL